MNNYTEILEDIEYDIGELQEIVYSIQNKEYVNNPYDARAYVAKMCEEIRSDIFNLIKFFTEENK